MKRFSIRSKSDSSTLTSSSKTAPPKYEDVEDASTADDHGLKLLSLGQVDGVPPVGTLIFIHGLGGHFTRTWSHERDSTFFWPKIWLPTTEGLRAVRIMSLVLPASVISPEHYS